LGKGPIVHRTKGYVGLAAAMVISYVIISYTLPPYIKQYKIQTTNLANTKYLKKEVTQSLKRKFAKRIRCCMYGENNEQMFLISG